jgi:hypothetical protein
LILMVWFFLLLGLGGAHPQETTRIRTAKPNVVGWYDGRDTYVSAMPPDKLNYQALTHIVFDSPSVDADGKVHCTPINGSKLGAELRSRSYDRGVKMQWSLSDDAAQLVGNTTKAKTFLRTLPAAVKKCYVDGLEFDWEGPATSAAADEYTKLLADIKQTMGAKFTVSADIAAWTSYPWITPKLMGGIDFVNAMTYFFDASGSIEAYRQAGAKIEKWGFDRAKINLGVPFYDSKESGWADIAGSCPDIDPGKNVCGEATFVGKGMAQQLGELVQSRGYGGAFPWQVNYDTASFNNSLFPWLVKGLVGPLPPSPPPSPPPTPGAHDPMLLPLRPPLYIYGSRTAAASACTASGYVGLCLKADLASHSQCDAGWASDFEGYWMAETTAGCGSKGYNTWSGPAGAWCCGVRYSP